MKTLLIMKDGVAFAWLESAVEAPNAIEAPAGIDPQTLLGCRVDNGQWSPAPVHRYATLDASNAVMAVHNTLYSSEIAGPLADENTRTGDVWDGQGYTRPDPATTPAVPAPLNQAQFRKRFTLAEKIAIYEAAPNSALMRVFLDDLAADTDGIHLDDPHTIAGINALQTAGLITAERAAEILTP